MTVTYGTDVSKWQTLNDEDFAKMREKGIDFVVIRASVGYDVDEKYEQHLLMAKRVGMIVGAYHYLMPEPDAYHQAELFWNVTNKRYVDFWVLDVEESGVTNFDVAAFKATFRGPGERLGFYSNPALLGKKYWKSRELFSWDWLARYKEDFQPTWLNDLPDEQTLVNEQPPTLLWQYTDQLNFRSPDGKERVDGNVFMGDQTAFLRYVGALTD